MMNLLITFYSIINGIDPALSFQLVKLESGMNPDAISRTGDGGLLQLNRRFYKFHNPKWIFNSEINLNLAMKTLSSLKNKCKHKNNNSYIVCYNLGIKGGSRIKNPFSQTYYKKSNILWRK